MYNRKQTGTFFVAHSVVRCDTENILANPRKQSIQELYAANHFIPVIIIYYY